MLLPDEAEGLDAEIFLLHGIDVTRCSVAGLKSSQHFRAGFGDLASAIFTVDAPGLTPTGSRSSSTPEPVDPCGRVSSRSRRRRPSGTEGLEVEAFRDDVVR